MKTPHLIRRHLCDETTGPRHRRGAMLVLAFFTLATCIAFVAFTIDIGVISHTKTRMQNACDAAALAAVLEISHAIQNAGPDVADVPSFAQAEARLMAEAVMSHNGIYIDPSIDVEFGTRSYNEDTGEFEITWGTANANVVKVTARKTNTDPSAPDARLPLFFAGFFGDDDTSVTAHAVAYIESRDMVSVLDFSRSMNFDSYFASEARSRLSDTQIVENLRAVWEDLQPFNLGSRGFTPEYVTLSSGLGSLISPKVTTQFRGDEVFVTTTSSLVDVKLTFSNGSTQTLSGSGSSGVFAGTGSNTGRRITSAQVRSTVRTRSVSNTLSLSLTAILNELGLGSLFYPYPEGSWSDYVNFVQTDRGLVAAGYNDMYGGLTYVCYLLKRESSYHETPDLWKTRHYPFHSVKEGQLLLCDFLENLGFDDELGTVSYDTYHRVEVSLNELGMPRVDISSDPITNDYQASRDLIQYKQASHYADATNMGGGLKDAIELLDEHRRVGARPAIILMTDGNSNVIDAGESTALPADWDWAELLDFDGDGAGDYYTTSSQKQYVLRLAYEAVQKGYTLHAVAVGQDGDWALMQAIAHLGGGEFIRVDGGSSISEMEAQVLAAYHRIAAKVPPAQLLSD